ncbi:MAG: hypothetical protein AB1545_16870 [Thermodesulfobacteriota bacterium]
MPSREPGLFSSLFKWAYRQDENYTTESFVYLLSFLQRNEPEIAAEILNFLTESKYDFSRENAQFLQIKTQASTQSGRPDIELRLHDI